MKILSSICASCLLCLAGNTGFGQGFKQLFNGKDLAGWTIHGTEKWYVEDGTLVCESGPDKQYGYLSTNEEYTDFILEVEFKLEANGNSGRSEERRVGKERVSQCRSRRSPSHSK